MNNNKKFRKGETMMPAVSFGYKCQECGEGTVREQIFHGYKTRLKGLPLTVDDARIGVCDKCGARHFDQSETKRWKTLLDEKYAEAYLQPSDIQDLIKQLGLSMEQFANLSGCTRQSLYNWQRPERSAPQSRMADLFLRLIRESRKVGAINVLDFLTEEAGKLGFDLEVAIGTQGKRSLLTIARKVRRESTGEEIPKSLALAAETKSCPDDVILESEEGQRVGRLVYDFLEAELKVEFLQVVPFDEFDAEILLKDGTHVSCKQSVIKNGEATLLEETKYQQDDIARVRFFA